MPALCVYWLVQTQTPRPWRCALLCLLGFVSVVCVAYLPYEQAWSAAAKTYTPGWSPFRSSIYFLLMPLLGPTKLASLHGLQLALSAIYVAAGAWLTLAPLARRQRFGFDDLLKQFFWLFALYFLVCAPAVLEWYLTWLLGAALLVRDARYFRFFAVLFAFYLTPVVFTLYRGMAITWPVNFLLYAFLVVCAWRLTRRPAAPSAVPGQTEPLIDVGLARSPSAAVAH